MTDHFDDRDLPQDAPELDEAEGDDFQDFTVDEFDADMIAAARLLPDQTGDDEDYLDLTEQEQPRQARSAASDSDRRQAILSAMRKTFGTRRSEAAARALASEIKRAGQRDEALFQPEATRKAITRFIRRAPDLSPDAAERLARDLHKAFRLQERPAQDGAHADLRAASEALRDAIRHLAALERRLAEGRGA